MHVRVHAPTTASVFPLSEVQFRIETHASRPAWQLHNLSFYLLFTIKASTCTHALKVPSEAGCEEDVANKHHTCSAVISALFTPCVSHVSLSQRPCSASPHRKTPPHFSEALSAFRHFELVGGGVVIVAFASV